MARSKHDGVVNRLKQKIAMLEKKQEQGKKKLAAALFGMQKFGKVYRNKLAKKASKSKVAKAGASIVDFEYKLLVKLGAQAREFAKTALKVEKFYIGKLKAAVKRKMSAKKKS